MSSGLGSGAGAVQPAPSSQFMVPYYERAPYSGQSPGSQSGSIYPAAPSAQQSPGALPAGMTLEAPAYGGAPAIPMLGNGASAPASGGTSSATPQGLSAYLASVNSKVPTAAQLNALTPSNPVATEMAAEQQAAQQAAAAQAATAAASTPAGSNPYIAGNYIGGNAAGGAIKGYADGGATAAPVIGGPTPSSQTASPIYQNLIQRFSQMTPEQLRQAVTYLASSPIGAIARQVLSQKQMLPNATPQPVAAGAPAGATPPTPVTGQMMGGMGAAAAAPQAPGAGSAAAMGGGQGLPYKRGGDIPHMAMGGNPMGIGIGAADPWWTRHAAFSADQGLLHSAIPGRTDHIAANPAADSFVIPADVVSGLGEGNTLAGARVLTQALDMGPYGTPMPRGRMGRGIPRPQVVRPPPQGQSAGGRTHKVPIAAAGGEFIVPPEVVHRIGNGDVDRGHKVLHHFVVASRARIIAEMQKLKEPVKS